MQAVYFVCDEMGKSEVNGAVGSSKTRPLPPVRHMFSWFFHGIILRLRSRLYRQQ